MSRVNNSIKNIKFALIGQIAGIAISFISRKVFVTILSSEYLGLNGLFSNILSVLSLAELGIGSAIIYSMYKPLAEKDNAKICALMAIYKKAYTYIGIFIAVTGISLTPFLNFFIKDIPDIPNIDTIYILFVANAAISYFYTYKRSLIIADQKRYITTVYRYGFYFILNIVQIIFLIITKNFLVYLGLQVLCTLLDNIFVSKKADELYPFLKENKNYKLDKKEKKNILRNVTGTVCNKIGGVVVSGTDNLLISKLVGIIEVGLYSNYYLISNALNTVYSLIFQSITASVGNLAATETNNRSEEIFNILNFFGFWIYGFSAICLVNLFNPFISIWLGDQYLFNIVIVIIISINFFITGMRRSVLIFHDAYGLYWYGKYKPLFEAVINLIASIILGIHFGVVGIFIGTTISTIATCFWVEPYILYKHGFKKSVVGYFIRYIIYLTVTLIAGVITFLLCNTVYYSGIIGLLIRIIICAIAPNLIFILIFIRDASLKSIINIVKNRFIKRS